MGTGNLMTALVLMWIPLAWGAPDAARATGLDSDGDGLSDWQEIHKYGTDPKTADTDGDGIADGGWNERREYAYTIRLVIRYLPPFDPAVLNDDYQDARVRERNEDFIELEVVTYPLGTAGEAIDANPNWQKDYPGMPELQPGVTTNGDEKMRQDVRAELKSAGIDVDSLTDKQVVEQVSSWAIRRGRSLDQVFTTYYVHFADGRPAVLPGLERAYRNEFARDSKSYDWSIDQHFDRELMGRGMYYNKTRGSCTSSAVYLTTVLRAVGIPTRMIICIPPIDANDSRQQDMLLGNISHNRVRVPVVKGAAAGKGFAAHTFNEVFVGQQWHRLNYNRLGQPILDGNYLGLMIHLYTFDDLSTIDLASTWGRKYGLGLRDKEFRTANPYKTVEIQDQFGVHARLDNPAYVPPPVVRSHQSRPEPNIFIMEPGGLSFSAYGEITRILDGRIWDRTGRPHTDEAYDEVFGGTSNLNPGDWVVLLFTLPSADRVSSAYTDLLPRPWGDIERDLEQGKDVELIGRARGYNVLLLAAPSSARLEALVKSGKALRRIGPASRPAASTAGQSGTLRGT